MSSFGTIPIEMTASLSSLQKRCLYLADHGSTDCRSTDHAILLLLLLILMAENTQHKTDELGHRPLTVPISSYFPRFFLNNATVGEDITLAGSEFHATN